MIAPTTQDKKVIFHITLSELEFCFKFVNFVITHKYISIICILVFKHVI